MTKTELKSYLAVIKGLAKTAKLDTFKGVAITDGQIQSTNLDAVYTLEIDIKGSGIYDTKALDLYLAGVDISSYKIAELEDWVEVPAKKEEKRMPLNMGAQLVEAIDYVSTDTYRPMLCRVWFKDNEVIATNGYKAYLSGNLGELPSANFSPALLKAYKRLQKYGDWTVILEDQSVELTNGIISLRDKLYAGEMADLRGVVDKSREYTHTVTLPLKSLLALVDKHTKRLDVSLDGTLSLEGRELPLKATVSAAPFGAPLKSETTVIMGMAGDSISIDLTLLKHIKAENITLRVDVSYDGKAGNMYRLG